MSQVIGEKVVAYTTQGDKLLVFSHPFHPEAGIQVPAGTFEVGESPHEAVIREAREEPGLESLEIRSFLGVRKVDLATYGQTGVQRYYFYHLQFSGTARDTWRHYETDPSDGSLEPIAFDFFWVHFPHEVPELTGSLGALLSKVTRE